MQASRTVVITGGSGFIGSHLAERLVANGDHVVVLDDLSTGSRENLASVEASCSLSFIEGSTLDAALVEDLLREANICVHLASAVGVQLVVDEPLESLLKNVRGSDIVLHAAARHGCRTLFASTSEVYGKNSCDALTEECDRILGPTSKSRWGYAIAKSFGESVAHGLHHHQGAETVTVRLFNTVGPRQTGQYGMVLPRFVAQALDGEDLTVHGDGTQTRCFTHVDDTVDALMLLLDDDAALGRVFNVGSDREVSVLALAQRVIEKTGSRSLVSFVEYADAFGPGFEELGRRRPDTSALRGLTGWSPTRTVDDAIDGILSFERNRAMVGEDASLAA